MALLDTFRRGLYGAGSFGFNGSSYPYYGRPQMIVAAADGTAKVRPPTGLAEYADQIYQGNGPVFALIAFRQLTFSTVEFKWQNLDTRELFGTSGLGPLEQPWQGATTQNLLARCEVDVSLAGNSYWARDGGELVWLRPDWVDVVLDRRNSGTYRKAGIAYYEDGRRDADATLVLPMSDVVHYMPIADPMSPWRGMSWITPVIRETMVDWASTTHQQRFFEQGASKRMAAVLPKEITAEQFAEFKRSMDERTAGVDNAYRTTYIGGGADLTVVGTDLAELDLRVVQGGLETRMAAAAQVPVSLVGFREGNQGSALNASTYGQARRRYADGTLDPLWREVSGSFAKVVRAPERSRLWFDTRHVPFMREDAKDAAEIVAAQISAVRQGVEAGFDPDSVVNAVMTDDIRKLVGNHSGLTSVQLLPPDQGGTPGPEGKE